MALRNAWKLYQKYAPSECSAEQMRNMVNEATVQWERGGKHAFEKEILIALMAEIERIIKAREREQSRKDE